MYALRSIVRSAAACLLAAAAYAEERAAGVDPVAAGAQAYALAEAGRQAALAAQFDAIHVARWLGGLPPLGAAGTPWAASPRLSGAWLPSAGTASLEYLYAHPDGAGPRTASPWPRSVFEPWPIVPGDLYGWPYDGWIAQPLGHRIVCHSANAYTDEPVFEPVYESPAGPQTAAGPLAGPRSTRPSAEHALQQPDRQAAPPDTAPPEELPPPTAPRPDPPRPIPPPPPEGDAVYQRARAAMAQARYGQVVALLTGDGGAARGNGRHDGRHDLLLGHALLALGEVEPAADAIRLALARLPQAAWGALVADFRDVYADPGEFQRHLRTVEQYVTDHPRSAQGRFLLGYLYGFLGYRAEAAAELQQVLALRGDDELARQLLRLFP